MKRKLMIISMLIIIFSLAACNKEEVIDVTDKTEVSIASLRGATSIGLAKLLDDQDQGIAKNNYQYEIFTNPQDIVAKMSKNELDIALVPANLAATLYNRVNAKILLINTYSVLQVVAYEEFENFSDLADKKVLTTGKGATPDAVLSYLYDNLGIDKTNIEFKTESTEIISNLNQNRDYVAVLPEPFATTSVLRNDELKISLDLNKEFENINKDVKIITGVAIVSDEFLKNNKEVVDKFIEEYEASSEYMKTNENAAKLVAKYNITTEEVAKVAIPRISLASTSGETMKKEVEAYLEVLFNFNKNMIGGAMPSEEFYYQK